VGGSISGLVKDSTGASLAGATVTVRQIETGATRILATNGDGRFYAPSVPVGDYLVSVAHDGFETGRQSGISLAIGQSLQLNFALGVEKSQQQIVVNAEQSSVNTTTQQTAGLINERAVKELPLNGRSFDELLTLNPATVNYTNQRSGGIGSSNSSVGNMFAIGGRRPQDNLFLLNAVVADELTQALIAYGIARRAGLKHVTYLSVFKVEQFRDVPHFASKLAVENALREFGVPYTILRPGYYLQNDAMLKGALLGPGIYPMPIGTAGICVQCSTTAGARPRASQIFR